MLSAIRPLLSVQQAENLDRVLKLDQEICDLCCALPADRLPILDTRPEKLRKFLMEQ